MKANLILLFHADLICCDDDTFKLVLCSTILVHCTFVKLCIFLSVEPDVPQMCSHQDLLFKKDFIRAS